MDRDREQGEGDREGCKERVRRRDLYFIEKSEIRTFIYVVEFASTFKTGTGQ